MISIESKSGPVRQGNETMFPRRFDVENITKDDLTEIGLGKRETIISLWERRQETDESERKD
jgi:hypothetical protein